MQSRYVDVVRAYTDVTFVQETLRCAREGVDSFHTRIYASALAIAGKVNVEEAVPRTTGRQQHRGNVPSTSPSEYFKRQLTIPALDFLIADLTERFSPRLTNALSQTIKLLPLSVAESSDVLSSTNIQDLVSLYVDDLPTPSSLDTELHCWSVKWRGKPEEAKVLNTPPKVLAVTDGDFFPSIKQLFYITSTLAVTSAECERSVSRLWHLKTYFRSTMLEDRLNGLAMMYVHRDIPCPPEAVVYEFARRQPRRLKLVNPFLE